ncbi:hypothetical protein GCM10010170_042080 [Dactylosporangium salmoneum]|uniref:Uncharacterized protein n=1 Tax=Dactylosporangium salmoneum TaxID=53361 RepID=A0ABN3GHI7_9ACTN
MLRVDDFGINLFYPVSVEIELKAPEDVMIVGHGEGRLPWTYRLTVSVIPKIVRRECTASVD